MPAPEIPPTLARLLDAALGIVRRSSSATAAIGRLEGVVSEGLLPSVLRPDVPVAIERAYGESAAPLDETTVEKLLAGAWGTKPGRVLESFDPEPLAVRPHAQVHRAVLDGEPVAIKVARPGLSTLARSDLSLLSALTPPLGAVFPAIDHGAMLAEIRERVMDEYDLENEGETQRRAARALRRLEGVRAAAVIADHTTGEVLVSEHVSGPTLAEAEGLSAVDRAVAAGLLVRVFIGAPRAIGMVLANPRANDIVVASDGLVLLQAGAARPIEAARLDASLDALEALRDDDLAAFTAAVSGRLGLLGEDDAATAFALVRRLTADLLSGPARVDDALLARLGERALDALPELLALGARVTPDPADLWAVRMLGQLAALLARLEHEADWVELALDAGRRGWD